MHKQHRLAIGLRLKQARLAAKLTQQDVASDFLCTRQAVSSWESGKTMPSLLEFRQMATLYAVSTDKLLYGVDSATEEGEGLLLRLVKHDAPTPPTFADSGC